MSSDSRVVVIAVVMSAVAGGAFLLWRSQRSAPLPAAPILRSQPSQAPPAPRPIAPTNATGPARPVARHPIRDPAAARPPQGGLPALDESDGFFKNGLSQLMGSQAASKLVVGDGFARRWVATVDNLATDNAAAELWPVRRPPGRFETTSGPSNVEVISPKNAERYDGFVRLAEAVDTQQAAAAYLRWYPLLQRAYEDLGYPDRRLNDRVLAVIDDLLATPDVRDSLQVKRVQIEGLPASAQTSGGLYVFDDPKLERCTAGQKILLRMGPSHANKLKAKLAEVRQQIAAAPVARPAPPSAR